MPNNTLVRTLADWRQQVGRLAASGLRGTALERALHADEAVRLRFATAFADEFGHRRPVDPPLLAWVLGLTPWREPAPGRIDAVLWHALTVSRPVVEPLGGEGPISPGSRHEGIEVWTEIELGALQALWWHARRMPEMRGRAISLARWIMAELQPDNATNRPWALAVFAELSESGDTEARLYADTLMHNCQVTLGRPDSFSTLILVDAERSLASAPCRR